MSTLTAAAAVTLAIVTQDNTTLRGAPGANAPTHAQLAAGDLVEVRGTRLDHLQVYDHRRERAGFVRASQVRPVALTEAEAPQLLSVLRFLRDTPGAEPLGIAYVAAYLRAAPAKAIDAEPFDALGTMAERLARRASQPNAPKAAATALETVAPYGVKFTSFAKADGTLALCYDGEAFRRVLAHAPNPEQRARAVLALARHDCIDPALGLRERALLDRARAEWLDSFDPAAFAQLSEPAKQRVRARRAGVWAAIAFERSRLGEAPHTAAQRALAELAAVNPNELPDDDAPAYTDAALRTGASRWAALPPIAPAARLSLRTEAGSEAGQTCIVLSDPKLAAAAPPLARRCTFGTVWAASARIAADARTAVVAVQPLEAWTELWVFRARRDGGWSVTVLPPAAAHGPGVGYIEFAGFVPGQNKMLVAREARTDGRTQRRFEVLSLDSFNAERWADSPQRLAAFNRWPDAAWKNASVALR